jgi:oligoribonuclease NrnB/cAMP/cGMP phosphodiesterase (DHH superfamily)
VLAAALVNFYIVDPSETKEFLALDYNSGFDPNLIDKTYNIWIVDFSLNLDVMWALNDRANKVYWYDHHATAINRPILEDHTQNTFGLRDVKRSAARLVWDDLFGGEPPRPVLYVEDRDLWRFRLPETRAFTEGLYAEQAKPESQIFETLINEVDSKHDSEIARLISIGEVLLKAKAQRIERAIKRGYYGTIFGHRAYFVNASEDISEIGEKIYMAHPDPIVVVIYYYFGADEVHLSFRSNSVDVEAIAQRMGGGGHIGAAGASFRDYRRNFHEQLKDEVEPNW